MNEEHLCKCGCGKLTKKINHTITKKNRFKGNYNKFISGHHSKGIPKSFIQKQKMAETRKRWYKNNPQKALLKAEKESITKIINGTHSKENNGRWKGGGNRFYHHLARKIYEEFYGTKLLNNQIIHHKDKNFKNNSPSNLLILTPSEHTSLHNNLRNRKGGYIENGKIIIEN